MKKLLFFTLMLNLCPFLAEQAQTQTPSGSLLEAWVARHHEAGNSNEYAHAMAVDPASGDVYVTGQSDSLGKPRDYLTAKYNAAGVRQWTARYNGPAKGDDYAVAVAVDAASNVYVTGTRGNNYYTVKYNSAGQMQWVARYNGPGNDHDEAKALGIDAAGNIYVTGLSEGDYAIIKYNSVGQEQWVKTYNGPGGGYDYAAALGIDTAGKIYVTGYSWNGANYDFATIKYTGNLLANAGPDKEVCSGQTLLLAAIQLQLVAPSPTLTSGRRPRAWMIRLPPIRSPRQ